MKRKYKIIITIIGLVSVIIAIYFIAFSGGILIGEIGLKPLEGGALA